MSLDSATHALNYPEPPTLGESMDDVTQTPAHAKPARRDHLWVLVIIAGFALADVWESWTQVGNKSGFAHGTGWTLTVIVEAYAGYALFAWFNAPGRRSRLFAMWSAFTMLALSLVGQGSSVLAAHALPPLWLEVFVKDLPVVTLALIAVLIHLRRLDREEVAAAECAAREAAQATDRSAAEASELAALQAALDAEYAARQDAEQQAAEAAREAAQATAHAEKLNRKLAAKTPNRTRTAAPNAGRGKTANAGAAGAPNAAAETTVPGDFDARTEALGVYLSNPKISGKDLGAAVGRGERWGQLRRAEFATAGVPAGPDAEGNES